MPLLPPLPKLLRDLRLAAGRTQLEAGSKIGKTDKTISAYEGGLVSPQVDDFLALLEFYGVTDVGALATARADVSESNELAFYGQPRESWVRAFERVGVESDRAIGIALGNDILGDPKAESDFVASARRAAENIASDALAQAAEPREWREMGHKQVLVHRRPPLPEPIRIEEPDETMVAEPKGEYDPPRKGKR